MGRDPFDPEDFLDLGGAKPDRPTRELPPIVQPPVYPRRQPAPAPRVAAPVARAPEAPRTPERAEQEIAARLTAPDPVLQPLAASRPMVRAVAQAEAPRAPVEHYIPGYGFQRQALAVGGDTGYDHAIAGPVYHRQAGGQAVAAQPAALEASYPGSVPEAGFEPEYDAETAYPGAIPAPSFAEQAPFRHATPQSAPRGASLQDWENDAAEARSAARQPAPPRRATPQRGPGLVREPMAVAFRGLEYATQTWSVYGFTLAAPLPGADEAPITEVTLMIARGVTRLALQVQVAAETDPGVRPARYAFIDLEPAQAEVLRRIAEHALANQARALAEMFEETDAALPPQVPQHYAPPPPYAPPPAPAPRQPEAEAWPYPSPVLQPKPKSPAAVAAPVAEAPKADPRKPRSGFAIGLRLSLALAALIAGGVYWNAQSTIDSRFGAVTVAATEMTAPEAGFITDLSVTEGRAVALGERLGTIRQTDIDFSLTETGRRRQALLAEQATLSAERETLRERAVQAALGETEGAAQENARALDAADLRLTVIAAELAAMPVPPGEGQPGAPILSPCECTVLTLNHHNGDWVDPDMPLAVLTAGEAASVHALLLGNEAREVAVGNHARLRLADGTSMAGTVERVSFDPHWQGYAGLDDDVFAAGRYARVEIRPERPLTAPVGSTAEVTVQSSQIWGTLRALAGM
ncbi:HlyD family efflux transporter periplasmic adaptor subunit [Pararhodobacter aggregans]|uniref:HlyD family efflux transporter periplasmic adaptor subunit n=1 Tax=Pararhodobacter aggregans TaxID=404875 RepID=UPI003A8E07EC